MVSRSLAAGNIIIPATANIMSGKTSVCSSPWVEAWRSASVPGSAAAWPANAVTPPSSRRSAKSSTLSRDSTITRPQMNREGPSIASAPSATTLPVLLVPPRMPRSRATSTVSTPAASRPTSASRVWIR